MVMVVRFLRPRSQHMKFLQNPALHLVGRLVGKSHRQDMSVRIPVLALEQQGNIFSCQSVGLSRARRGFHYL